MTYCEGFFKLKAELAVAEQADQLEAKVTQLNSQLGELNSASAAKATDPQSQMLASLTGRTTEEVQISLTVLIALLVELGASLGFYTAFSYWRIFDVKGLPAPEPVRVAAPNACVCARCHAACASWRFRSGAEGGAAENRRGTLL